MKVCFRLLLLAAAIALCGGCVIREDRGGDHDRYWRGYGHEEHWDHDWDRDHWH